VSQAAKMHIDTLWKSKISVALQKPLERSFSMAKTPSANKLWASTKQKFQLCTSDSAHDNAICYYYQVVHKIQKQKILRLKIRKISKNMQNTYFSFLTSLHRVRKNKHPEH